MPRDGPGDSRPTTGRILAMVALGMLFVLAFIRSVVVTVAWWKGELHVLGLAEWFWIGLLPVLLFVYLRYFSVFACPPGQCPVDLPDDYS